MSTALKEPRIRYAERRQPLGWPRRLRQAGSVILSGTLFVLVALIVLPLNLLTLFRCRRFIAERIAAPAARLGLRLHGVRVEVEGFEPPPGQVVYISNHTSALDPFVIVGLGLPNSRYFMGGFLRVLLPLWIVGSAIGTFWTPRQTHPERRRRLFRRAAETLKRSGESVFLTPEGQLCWHFNKGAFHLALDLGVPIVPFFIHIDRETDPGPWTGGEGFDVRSGVVRVRFRDPIDTSGWRVEDLDEIRFGVRRFYYDWAVELGDKSVAAFEETGKNV